ncbi:DUF4230 domain-containing protein [Acidovorax sp. GBBC 3334]|uniref:DUF4230 domain-containing protein n=1 Tax=Acidovorax sp. GBBC 3334 TaxID=2940496 RepID=UPI002302C233|nr:DUF4230 domain-containing protein [Acidovorax sp. GBBC 3334]MDA8453222.1 DUF4230 domain-containing protein [Acidovorax sp. GBBC 3334]
MQRLTFPALLAGAALVAAASWTLGSRRAPPPAEPATPPLVAVESMGELVSVRVRYANVIEFSQKMTQDIPWTQWELRLGETRVLLVARGDCLVGTDLRAARYEQVDAAARTAVLALPAPRTVSARVDHGPRERGGSYFHALQGSGLEPLLPGSAHRMRAIDAALRIAQQDVEKACAAADTVQSARANTEAVLKPLLSASGWTVTPRWR